MIKPNNQNSNSQFLATQKSLSNTNLFLHNTQSLTNNSFNRLSPLPNKSKIKLFLLNIRLDYLRVSGTIDKKKYFDNLLAYLGLPIPCFENKISWHPSPRIPKSKKYQNRIVSKEGIVLGYTKRLLNNSNVFKYVYDIMIDFTGAYFRDLSLLKQLKVVSYLNSHFQLKCHRIDVALDDYSRSLFPVGQMITAFLMGNTFGFQVIDENYLELIVNKLVGTLGIGSRFSELFIRIYTRYKYFVRWETELKREKAQKLFDILFDLSKQKYSDDSLAKDVQKALFNAALDDIDCRDKSSVNSPKNATRDRTERLPFWSNFRESLFSSIENQTSSNELLITQSKI